MEKNSRKYRGATAHKRWAVQGCVGLVLLVALLSGACGGIPDDPLTSRVADNSKCNPKTAFANGVLQQDNKRYVLFQKKEEYGCMGVTWAGREDDPKGFVVQLKQDGSYLVMDPTTKKFTNDTKIGETVAAGINKVTLSIYFMKVDAAQATSLNCPDIIKGDLRGCWSNANCLMVWRGENLPMDANGEKGSCRLCAREECNGVDNDCNGKVDEGEGNDPPACGVLVNQPCKFTNKETIDSKAFPCSKDTACSCFLTPSRQVFFCGGEPGKPFAWRNITTVNPQCTDQNDGKSYQCGKTALICDICGSGADKKRTWRATSSTSCANGTLDYGR